MTNVRLMSTAASPSTRRVAVVANTGFYVGPTIARSLAERGHDLVVGDPEDGLVDELEALGSTVEVVTGVADLRDPDATDRLVAAALGRFGRLDAATCFTGQVITGRFLQSTVEDLGAVLDGCVVAPYHFLRAVVPVMVEAGQGQVLLLTSSSGTRVTPGAPLYSSARAAANHLIRNVAAEVARNGVQVNGLGTNFMDFPEFLRASGASDPVIRAKVEGQVPMRRLGTVEECGALCTAFLDGSATFMTGQFTSFDGGWS
jgi:NAD(P)-dependent dehydrogenase (short-subunit alcohol dehydrogenase family)